MKTKLFIANVVVFLVVALVLAVFLEQPSAIRTVRGRLFFWLFIMLPIMLVRWLFFVGL